MSRRSRRVEGAVAEAPPSQSDCRNSTASGKPARRAATSSRYARFSSLGGNHGGICTRTGQLARTRAARARCGIAPDHVHHRRRHVAREQPSARPAPRAASAGCPCRVGSARTGCVSAANAFTPGEVRRRPSTQACAFRADGSAVRRVHLDDREVARVVRESLRRRLHDRRVERTTLEQRAIGPRRRADEDVTTRAGSSPPRNDSAAARRASRRSPRAGST